MNEPESIADTSIPPDPLAPLGREEYIEQAHFWATLAEWIKSNVPTQDILVSVREEVLATTKLPLAVDFLLAELRHLGALTQGMRKLSHYFTAFQCYVMSEAENDRGRFDLRAAVEILRREATYRTEEPTVAGLFLYQFEVLCRHRLGYDGGLTAVAEDAAYAGAWRDWILALRRQIGMIDIADLIYVQSAYYDMRRRHGSSEGDASNDGDSGDRKPLFGEREGRIALANRRKDPLIFFASLHRQLGYPKVPEPQRADPTQDLLPQLARRMELLETRLRLVEEEQRSGIDITKFYARPDSPSDLIGPEN